MGPRRSTTGRLTAVGALLALALVAGAAPAAAAPPGERPDCGGAPGRREPVDRVLATLGLAVLLDARAQADLEARAAERSGPPCPPPTPARTPRPAGYATSAAALRGWGEPTRVEEFDGTRLGRDWRVDSGAGVGPGARDRRTPPAVDVRGGVLTLAAGPRGDGVGVDWTGGRRHGRWEARVRVSAGDPAHTAVLMLWPDAGRVPPGVEIDFMRTSDPARRWVDAVVRDGRRPRPPSGGVAVDATQWHNWAVEWTPTQVVAFLDGRQWWRTDRADALPPGPMHLAVALDPSTRPARGPVRTTTLQVDRVAQYAAPADRPGPPPARARR